MALLLIRRTGQRSELDRVSQLLASLALLLNYSTQGDANIGNGTTAGRLRTNATAAYRIGTGAFSKPSTDNLWNLSAQTDTAAGEYKAFWLLLDGSLAGSIAAGTAQASAVDALAALPALDGTKAVVGVFVAGIGNIKPLRAPSPGEFGTPRRPRCPPLSAPAGMSPPSRGALDAPRKAPS